MMGGMNTIACGGPMDSSIRIEKLENGYEVEVCDPKVKAENEKPKTQWKDPWKKYAFSTSKEVIKFVTAHLESMPKSADEIYDEAFKEASKEK